MIFTVFKLGLLRCIWLTLLLYTASAISIIDSINYTRLYVQQSVNSTNLYICDIDKSSV